MKKIMTLVFLMGASFQCFADEHGPANMKGDNIEFFEMQHAFSGKLFDHPFYAGFDHQPYGTNLVLRKNDKTLQARIEPRTSSEGEESKLSGILSEVISVEQTNVTMINLVSIQKNDDQSALFTFLLDEKNVMVLVKGESFENGHFLSPHFEATLGNNETLAWTFTGKSCLGYSANIAASILLATAHLKK